MRFLPLFFALATLWLGSSPVHAGELETTMVDESNFTRVIQMMGEDTETNELLSAVKARLGASSPEDLMSIVRLAEIPPGSRDAGMKHHSQTYWAKKPAAGKPVNWNPAIGQATRQGLEHEEHDLGGGIRELRVVDRPVICMRKGETLLNSFVLFVHELAHFRGMDQLHPRDILDYSGAEQFVGDVLSQPGGELEAYVAQVRAIKKLRKRAKIDLKLQMEVFFDADGKVVDAAGLKNMVLDSLGYRQSFLADYRSQLGGALVTARRLRKYQAELKAKSHGAAAEVFERDLLETDERIKKLEGRLLS